MKHTSFSSHVVTYLFGFGAALCLSVAAYLVATESTLANTTTMAILLLLAAVQLVVQLACFLHMRVGGRSQTRTVTMTFTLLMMLIVVVGSLWVMKNLDYRMGMSGEAMNEYMKAQNKKGF